MTRTRSTLFLAYALVLATAVALVRLGAPAAAGHPALDDLPLHAPGQWFEAQRFGGADGVEGAGYQRALAQNRAAIARTAAEAPHYAEAAWTFKGPQNIGGRVLGMALDASADAVSVDVNGNKASSGSVVYAATASGGVWSSGNSGVTWRYAWDPTLTQATGAIAIDPDGTIYVGTGESGPGGGSITYGGTGIYRSVDQGDTWEWLGLPQSGAFGDIELDPANPQRIFAAASGRLYEPGGQRGLYLSEDGGATWKRVLKGENDTTGAVDVSVDPQDPNNVLVALWDHTRYDTHRVYAGVGSGVWRSTDGGKSFVEVLGPDIDVDAHLEGGDPEPDPEEIGRIGVAFAPSDPDRAYAIVASKASGHGVGLWRSDDGGATWAKTAANVDSLTQSSYGWWFGKVWPDPADAERVFVAGLELVESTDGGDTFLAHSSSLVGVVTGAFQAGPTLHADQHAMVWDPLVPGRVYVGNDGGTYRSDANGVIGSWIAGVEQGWTQHYSVDVSNQRPDYIVTGLQDNLCQRSNPGTGVGTSMSWTKYGLCGDGLQTLIHPGDDTITWGCSQYGGCQKQRAGVPLLVQGFGSAQGRKGWFTPLEFDPSNPEVMYFGTDRVYRSTNGSSTWVPISEPEELTGEVEQLDPNPGYRIFGTITTIAASKTAPETLYVGTDTGRLWKTEDLGGEWVELSDDDLPGTWVTRVAVDPTDAAVAYVTYSSFRNGSDAAHVLRTTDGGASWENISGDLPDAPVSDVLPIGDRLVVATDVGVYISETDGVWYRLGASLPAVPVLDMRYQADRDELTVATFGHGIQRIVVPPAST